MTQQQQRRLVIAPALALVIALALLAVGALIKSFLPGRPPGTANQHAVKVKIKVKQHGSANTCTVEGNDKPDKIKVKDKDDLVIWTVENHCKTQEVEVALKNLTYVGPAIDENSCGTPMSPPPPYPLDEVDLPKVKAPPQNASVPGDEAARMSRTVRDDISNSCWKYEIYVDNQKVDPEFVIWR